MCATITLLVVASSLQACSRVPVVLTGMVLIEPTLTCSGLEYSVHGMHLCPFVKEGLHLVLLSGRQRRAVVGD